MRWAELEGCTQAIKKARALRDRAFLFGAGRQLLQAAVSEVRTIIGAWLEKVAISFGFTAFA